jgi:hypothetical protein
VVGAGKVERGLRHGRGFRVERFLHDGDAAALADAQQPLRAVVVGAGHDDADEFVAVDVGRALEQHVDRGPREGDAFVDGQAHASAVFDEQVVAARCDVDGVVVCAAALARFAHGHAARRADEFAQGRDVFRAGVADGEDRRADVAAQFRQHFLERAHAARRTAEDDGARRAHPLPAFLRKMRAAASTAAKSRPAGAKSMFSRLPRHRNPLRTRLPRNSAST